MKKVAREALLSYQQWEASRSVLRPLFIADKERRRFHVGPHITLLFENAQSVWYQVEEMLRVERITDEAAVRHELDTYNELLPGAGELSATMLIEFEDADERDAALRRWAGLERHVKLRVGDRRVEAQFDAAQMSETALSAVQFVRFAVGGRAAETLVALAEAGTLAIEIDHPALALGVPLGVDLARVLAQDLREPG